VEANSNHFSEMQPLFHRIGQSYGFGEVVGCEIGGGLANENYVVQFEKDKYFLKFLSGLTSEDIDHQVSIIDRAVSHSFPTVSFIRQHNSLAYFEHEDNLIIVQPWVSGLNIEILETGLLIQIGHALSSLHHVPIHDLTPRSTWWDEHFIDKQFESLVKLTNAEMLGSATKVINRIQGLRSIPRDEFPISIVHGDPWAGNFLWENDDLKCVLDWDEVTIAPSIYDLIYVALTGCFKNDGFDVVAFNGLISAYQQDRMLHSMEKQYSVDIADRLACTNSVWLLQKCQHYHAPKQLLEIIDWLLGLDIEKLSLHG
jgi:Ser/Thr protein kinase RdoA (MazF antagonist)